jgi:hypothetical protein
MDEELEADPNKYARRVRVGRPSLGRTNYIETTGLNNLRVLTANGNDPEL